MCPLLFYFAYGALEREDQTAGQSYFVAGS